jgi:ethanolamine-phosphate cytidylyltransferase
MMHFGHANALRQAKALGAILVVGVHSDAEILRNKGPPVMNEEERYAAVRACQWADEVVEDAPYTTSLDVMDKYNCDFCVHGDDIVMNADGQDTYGVVKAAGRFKTIPRTQGVSTTQLVNRMLALAATQDAASEESKSEAQPKEKVVSPYSGVSGFIPTTRKLVQFLDGRGVPPPSARIVYIDGGFDLFHVGHGDVLKKAKELGSYLVVGVWDDNTVKARTGGPVMNLQERLLSVLSCRYVDEVVIGAPYILSDELIKSNQINLVVAGSVQDPSTAPPIAEDRFAVAKKLGIFQQLESPRSLTTSEIIGRIKAQRKLYEERNAKKEAREVAEIKERGY